MDGSAKTYEALHLDMAAFGAHVNEWLKCHHGQYVLIHQGQLVDFFPNHDQALEMGYREFRRDPFLVRKVEPIQRFKEVVHTVGGCLA
jgi:hypothetical protein